MFIQVRKNIYQVLLTWLKMSEIAPDTVLKMQIKVIKYIQREFFGRSQTIATVTYFAKCLLASFSPCLPIFIQSLKGICIKLREREML